jgi:25S rRNA (uracil2634-N3)-methyltransferase
MAGASSEDGAKNVAALVAIAGGGGVVEETPAAEGSAAVAVTDGRQEGFPAVALEETEEDEDAKWVGEYSSTQSILLVGEGDFSFSLALATGFGSGENIVATSLDRYGKLSFPDFQFFISL